MTVITADCDGVLAYYPPTFVEKVNQIVSINLKLRVLFLLILGYVMVLIIFILQ